MSENFLVLYLKLVDPPLSTPLATLRERLRAANNGNAALAATQKSHPCTAKAEPEG